MKEELRMRNTINGNDNIVACKPVWPCHFNKPCVCDEFKNTYITQDVHKMSVFMLNTLREQIKQLKKNNENRKNIKN